MTKAIIRGSVLTAFQSKFGKPARLFRAPARINIIAKPLLGQFTGAFRYIQEFTGFFTPDVCALFLMGIFWKRTTANGALGIILMLTFLYVTWWWRMCIAPPCTLKALMLPGVSK